MSTAPVPDDLRDRLAPLIRRKGVRATARSVGVHHAMLVDWMSRKRDIPSDVLVRLAGRLGMVVRICAANAAWSPPTPPAARAGSRTPRELA